MKTVILGQTVVEGQVIYLPLADIAYHFVSIEADGERVHIHEYRNSEFLGCYIGHRNVAETHIKDVFEKYELLEVITKLELAITVRKIVDKF